MNNPDDLDIVSDQSEENQVVVLSGDHAKSRRQIRPILTDPRVNGER